MIALPGVTAGHRTVLLDEAVAALNLDGPRREGIYIDGTFGRGGHSRAILAGLGDAGRLVAFDRDPAAIAAGAALADRRLELRHSQFSALGESLRQVLGRDSEVLDGVLLDIGVSSPQLDEGERGFSFRQDGPLDMRMDTTRGETAAEWLNRASETEITEENERGDSRTKRQIRQQRIGKSERQNK